ncbi:MAG TPA: hypothetical protein VIS48_12875 [Candidatus Kryptonia bacterium]
MGIQIKVHAGSYRSFRIPLIHAFVGWALCAETIELGVVLTTLRNTLYIHAVLAPVIFFVVSLNYFKKYNHLSPFRTAIAFTSFIILVDFFVVGLAINRSLNMFSSMLGTWIPFALIFLSTYLTGMVVNGKRSSGVSPLPKSTKHA